jgi:hypothetical protein
MNLTKKHMKNYILTALACFLMVTGSTAQTAPETPTTVVETMYILPKRGMENKLEAAIKAHNAKFHPAGPFVAGLRKVEYGEKSGWYVFVYGPTTYDNIDNRPEKANGHDVDWSTTTDPLIETYGATTLWNLNKDLSFGFDILQKSKYYELWSVKLKEGEYYRFKALSEKLKKAYESLGNTAFVVYESPLHNANGQDIGLIWSFNTYKEWADDPGPKAAYEKIYGAGSWQNMLKEWRDVCVDYNDEIRSFVR